MMKILNIIKYDLIKMTRDKTALLFMVLLPCVMIFVFGNISFSGTSKIPSGIVNLDKEAISNELVKELKADKVISFEEYKEEDIIKDIEDSAIEMGFIIPSGFTKDILSGKTPVIKVIRLKDTENAMAAKRSVSNAMANVRNKDIIVDYFTKVLNLGSKTAGEFGKKVGENLEKPDLIQVINVKYEGKIQSKTNENKANITVGFMIMFVMMTIIFASAGVMLEEKKDNTWERLILTPTGSPVIFLGNILSTFIKGFIQVAFIVLFSKLLLNVNWGNSLLALIVLMAVFILCVTGIGMFLSTLVKTNSQLNAIASVVVTCTAMISGCYWPIELEPEFMQKTALVFPQYWAMKGMRSVIESGLGFEAIVQPILILFSIGVLFFAASVLKGGLRQKKI
ncbi:MAG TPA: ABC transporter permease [Pseudobacteroides sp.]|uniref:ABC transporter permease n=1 Tax=Pseudobacteroides sp. TaxID=1968840 RepID=UPI002F9573A8